MSAIESRSGFSVPMNVTRAAKYVLPPVVVDALRWALARGGEPATPEFTVRFELADRWQSPPPAPPSQGPVKFQPAKDGLGSFDFPTVQRSIDVAMNSPIVRDNLAALGLIKMKSAALLDWGCADGRYLPLLRSFPQTAGWRYVGADTDAGLIQFCRAANPQVRFEVLRGGEPLPFRDGEFDVVLASGVLQAIRDYAAALSDLRRVVTGYAVISRLPVWKHHASGILLQRVSSAGVESVASRHVFNRGDFEAAAARAGFALAERDYGSEVYFVSGVAEPVIFSTFLLKAIDGAGENSLQDMAAS